MADPTRLPSRQSLHHHGRLTRQARRSARPTKSYDDVKNTVRCDGTDLGGDIWLASAEGMGGTGRDLVELIRRSGDADHGCAPATLPSETG